jgi:uncharacterized protein (DUF2141 family)
MKKLYVLLVLFTVSLSALNLSLQIYGVDKSQKGQLIVKLFKQGMSFPDEVKPLKVQKFPVTQKEFTLSFGLKKGEYAIAVFHDSNRNGKYDGGFLGFGGEGYGYSNNYKFFPSFKKSQINVNTDTITKVIINY